MALFGRARSFVPDVVEATRKQKYVFQLVRLRGRIPLSEGVTVTPCKSALNRIKKEAAAFEINLRHAQVHPR